MTNIMPILEKLARAKNNGQFEQMVAGYETSYRRNLETLRAIELMKELKEIGRRR